jgi:hypothetical protein
MLRVSCAVFDSVEMPSGRVSGAHQHAFQDTMEFKGLQWILWVLAAEALVLVLYPSGRLGKLLLALTFVAVAVGFTTWAVIHFSGL